MALSQAWDVLGYDQTSARGSKASSGEFARSIKAPSSVRSSAEFLQLERIELGRCDRRLPWTCGCCVRASTKDCNSRACNLPLNAGPTRSRRLRIYGINFIAPENNDPRIDIAEAQVREALTQFPEMEQAARLPATKPRIRARHFRGASSPLDVRRPAESATNFQMREMPAPRPTIFFKP